MAVKVSLQSGDMVRPWLMLGPFYEDLSAQVQGLTLFEKAGAVVGRTMMEEVMAQAHPILISTPHEGDATVFRGKEYRWSLVRRPEKYLSWGQYNISNHLGAIFLTTLVTSDKPGMYAWRLAAAITLRAVVAINGVIVFDSAGYDVKREGGVFQYDFEAALQPGENRVNVGLFRLGRMAQVGCRLEVRGGAVQAQIPLREGMSLPVRNRIEEDAQNMYLERDLFYPHHAVGVVFRNAPQGAIHTQLLSSTGDVLAKATSASAGLLELCRGDDLPDGTYDLRCTWLDGDVPVTSVNYALRKVTPHPAPQGYDRYDERRRQVLQHYSLNREGRPIWTQVARYALLRQGITDTPPVDEGSIRETCEFIAARKDCADFVIQGILRLMIWEREQQRLSPEINALMKDTVLGFKYWVDEPGDTIMYMGSENHRLLFHVAEWLAGQLFPTEEFTNSRMRGLYHATKGRTYITEWLRQRGRFGFDEWHSNSYYPVNIAPLLNVRDFAIYEDAKLRQMADAVLDMMFFNLAADTYHGIFGTTHGRSYGINLKYPDFEGTSPTCWLLYGTGALSLGSSGMSPVTLATSDYSLPKILFDMANDDKAIIESHERQGLMRGAAQSANFCVYRTPDYMVSGLQDHRKGELESSSHVAQVTLGQKPGEQPAVVFWSCPLTSGEGSGLRPDYWSGHITLPRVVQAHNVLVLTWRLTPFAWMSHCFFEPARFDEVRLNGNWAFARVNSGFVGIYSQNGLHMSAEGQYAGRELVCDARENTWLVECGREADWGSFDAFVQALSGAAFEVGQDHITYASPSIGRFVTGWDIIPTLNGALIPLNDYPLVDSPWAHADFGSGEMILRYGNEKYELWFNQ